jgi:hypothetical protein
MSAAILIPAGVESQLVVGQHVGPLLGQRHVIDAQARRCRHTKLARRLHATVSGENTILSVD